VVGVAVIVALIYVAWETARWPSVAALATRPPRTTAFIERHRALEREAGRSARVQWTWVPYGRIATSLKRAVVVAEDASFFAHRGFATAEIREAIDRAVREFGLPRGASTITCDSRSRAVIAPAAQQLAHVGIRVDRERLGLMQLGEQAHDLVLARQLARLRAERPDLLD